MADPITLAMVGGVAGAALKPRNPLQGALLGATMGYTGGSVLGAIPSATAPAAGGVVGGTGLASGGTALGGGTGIGLTAPQTMPGLGLSAPVEGLAAPTSFGGYGLTPASMPTFSQQLSGAAKFLKDNPSMALSGINATQGLLQQEPIPQAPSGQVQRGQPLPPVNFAQLLSPPQIKPQPISLLG